MAPAPDLDGGYASRLFNGPQPTTVGFSEQAAFRHYLHALRGQAQACAADSYDEAVEIQDQMLNEAEELLGRLTTAGVRGQLRDFSECIDVNRAALALLNTLRGPMLRRRWNSVG